MIGALQSLTHSNGFEAVETRIAWVMAAGFLALKER